MVKRDSNNPLAYLDSLDAKGIRLGLAPVRRLLSGLGNPHRAYRSILIAGTNGKGSIAAMTASILRKSGYCVGLYTSPHLVDFRERIRVNGRIISKKELNHCIKAVRCKVGEEVTWFEFVTAVAFLHFCRQGVDIAVLEVGMGGRLDATNVVKPMVSVISNISLEHREYLGNSLLDIAGEKGGVICSKGVCISAAKQNKVLKYLDDICLKKDSALYVLGRDFKIRKNPDKTLSYNGRKKEFSNVVCPLKGKHQMENAALAMAVAEVLMEKGMNIQAGNILEGIRKTSWEGRLEVVHENPLVLFDGAHNPAGVTVLCRALREDFHYRHLIIIFGVLSDKDVGRMLSSLCPLADRLILTKPDIGRSLPVKSLLNVAERYHKLIMTFDNIGESLSYALDKADERDLICVTGSLYLVGEAKKAFPFVVDYAKRVTPNGG